MTNRQKVAAALRSGEFKQGFGTLQEEDRYCCLGVACVVAEREGIPVLHHDDWYLDGEYLIGTDLNSQPAVRAWLGLDTEEERRAMNHNDIRRASFAQIAHWVFDK